MPVENNALESPGVYINETDNTELAGRPRPTGPVVVGTAKRGPAMRPVTVKDSKELVEMFGQPYSSGISQDVWRSGDVIEATFGMYAAKAWLANNDTLTFVRLLGTNHPDATAGGGTIEAGWTTANTPVDNDGTNGGAFGVYLTETSDNAGDTYIAEGGGSSYLAAIFYVESGSVTLEGVALDAGAGSEVAQTATLADGAYVASNAANAGFNLVVRDDSGTVVETKPINFNRTSANYIRKVANTNPTKTNTELSDSGVGYWLGQTYDQFINDQLDISGAGTGEIAAVVLPILSDDLSGQDHTMEATAGVTPWILSQHVGTNTDFTGDATTGKYPVEELFRIHSLETGSWESKNLKVSIKNVQPPRSNLDDYGTFTVEVRSVSDSDEVPRTIEVFSGLKLDPSSPDYIAAKIGDTTTTWNETDKLYEEVGSYPNRSKYIRVEVSPSLDRGELDAALLPFGYHHPATYIENAPGTSVLAPDDDTEVIAYANDVGSTGGVYDSGQGAANDLVPPKHVHRSTSSEGNLRSAEDAYWGIVTFRETNRNVLDASYSDIVHAKPAGIDPTEPTTDVSSIPYIVSLDDLVLSNGVYTWTLGSRAGGTSYTASGNDAYDLLEAGQNSFTVPVVGGFDGLDITETNPFRNTMLDGTTELNNYAYNSIKRAIDSVRDTDVVNTDIMTVPGLTNSSLTEYGVNICEQRGDALFIFDLENDYQPASEGLASTYPVEPDLNLMINEVKDRTINSSHGAVYSSWVQIRDNRTGRLLYVPPSTIALGVMSYSQAVSQPWFAPAGFNRGGLSQGTAGLPVVNIRRKWNKPQRDKLYTNSINPIARFPSIGFVVYGQKTLLLEDSLLTRINVRRMVNYLKAKMRELGRNVLFDPNVDVTWQRFRGPAEKELNNVQSKFGIEQYKLQLDDATTTQDLIDRNIVYAKLLVKPVTATEFLVIDFAITNNSSDFE